MDKLIADRYWAIIINKWHFFLPVLYMLLGMYAPSGFVYPSLMFYYWFLIGSNLLICFVLIKLWNRKELIEFSLPCALAVLILLLLITQIFLVNQPMGYYYYLYFVFFFVLYLFLSVGVNKNIINLDKIKDVLLGMCVVELLVCLFQLLDFLPHNTYFLLTGCSQNPNVTAIFLVLISQLIWNEIRHQTSVYSIFFFILVLFSAICVIIYLKSRTAYIGLFVIVVANICVFLYQRVKKYAYVFVLVSIVVSFLFVPLMYRFKSNSADGRLLCWKISKNLFLQNPIMGCGFGNVEFTYNVAQAKYFMTEDTTQKERWVAGYQQHLLNDYLDILVQGGFVIFLLYILFITSLLYFGIKKRDFYGLIGLLSVIIMQFFNTLIYHPIIAFCILYYVVLLTESTPRKFKFSYNKISILILCVCVLLFTGYEGVQAYSQHQLKKVIILLKDHKIADAQLLAFKSSLCISTSELYYDILGDIYFEQSKYREAMHCYQQAYWFAPTPTVSMKLAVCYYFLGDMCKTESYLLYAANQRPILFEPHYQLMLFYHNRKSYDKALVEAEIIKNKAVKIDSRRVDFIKLKAQQYLIANQ